MDPRSYDGVRNGSYHGKTACIKLTAHVANDAGCIGIKCLFKTISCCRYIQFFKNCASIIAPRAAHGRHTAPRSHLLAHRAHPVHDGAHHHTPSRSRQEQRAEHDGAHHPRPVPPTVGTPHRALTVWHVVPTPSTTACYTPLFSG